MQPLLAELVELDLPGEVGADDLLDGLGDGRLERVAVDAVERVQTLCGVEKIYVSGKIWFTRQH